MPARSAPLSCQRQPFPPAERNAGACHRHVLNQKKNRQLLQQDVAPIVTILPVQAALVAAKTALISICAKNKYGDSVTAGNGLSCKRQHS